MILNLFFNQQFNLMKTIDRYDGNLKQAILDLPYSNKIDDNGEGIFIPESDYGFAEIYRIYDDILLFTIPTYGGTPSFHKCYRRHAIDNLINELLEMC